MQQRKALSRVEIKDADKGQIEAVFATLDVIDKDGDVTLKGAFTDGAPVAISAYGHTSWKGQLPVGKGRIRETKSEAILEGQFLMNTTHGRDTFETVKALADDDGPGQEWSYSLRDVVSERGTFKGEQVRFLKSINVHEVSPVLVGAGVDTRVLAVKGVKLLSSDLNERLRNAGRERWGAEDTYVWVDDYDLDDEWVVFAVSPDNGETRYVRVDYERADDDVTLGDTETDVLRVTDYAPKSARFTEHAQAVLADVRLLNARASEVVALRAEKGKTISTESADLLAAVEASVKQLSKLMEAVRSGPDHTPDDVQREFARFVSITSQGAMT